MSSSGQSGFFGRVVSKAGQNHPKSPLNLEFTPHQSSSFAFRPHTQTLFPHQAPTTSRIAYPRSNGNITRPYCAADDYNRCYHHHCINLCPLDSDPPSACEPPVPLQPYQSTPIPGLSTSRSTPTPAPTTTLPDLSKWGRKRI